MKVLVVSDYRPFHSVRPEAEFIIGLKEAGVDVRIMTFADCSYNKRFSKYGIPIIEFQPEQKFNRDEIQFVQRYLKDEEIDIMHIFNGKTIINCIKAARKEKCKVILYRGYSQNIHWYDPASYTKFLNPRVDYIHCNSIGVEEHLHDQLFFNKSKTKVINKGHRIEWYENIKTANLQKEYDIPADAFCLVNVCYNRRMKGIPYLLQAMKELPNELPIHLLLVGKNMKDDKNMAILNQFENKDKIHFLGFQSEPLPIVKAANAFILPSIKGESITKSVIEAMCLETCPIISDIRGNVELVNHQENGLIFPSKNIEAIKDSILQAFGDREKTKLMGIAAKKHIQENLNTDQTVAKLHAFYKEILA